MKTKHNLLLNRSFVTSKLTNSTNTKSFYRVAVFIEGSSCRGSQLSENIIQYFSTVSTHHPSLQPHGGTPRRYPQEEPPGGTPRRNHQEEPPEGTPRRNHQEVPPGGTGPRRNWPQEDVLTCRSNLSSPQTTALFQSMISENGSTQPLLSNTGIQAA